MLGVLVDLYFHLALGCLEALQGGLQGFNVGERYRVEEIEPKKRTPWARIYWRVWPVEGSHYQTCGVALFNQFFKVIE